eukprot:860971_1
MGAVEMGWIQTGLEYQAFHTLAILGLAVAMQRRISIWFYWSSVFLALGTVLFSGSLYCLALSHLRLWAFVIPKESDSLEDRDVAHSQEKAIMALVDSQIGNFGRPAHVWFVSQLPK